MTEDGKIVIFVLYDLTHRHRVTIINLGSLLSVHSQAIVYTDYRGEFVLWNNNNILPSYCIFKVYKTYVSLRWWDGTWSSTIITQSRDSSEPIW